MSSNDNIRVLLADDHEVVREGLASIIARQSDMVVVAQAADGREAVALFRQHRPDVMLVDLRMPELGGVDVIRTIRAEFRDSRIIVLTTYDGEEEIYQALRAGAKSYLLKGTRRSELLDAIRAVHHGQRHIPPPVASRLAEHMDGSELTPRELEVLRLVVKGMSNQQIGESLGITVPTVKGHVNEILSKLDVADRTQAVTTALRRGIVQLD